MKVNSNSEMLEILDEAIFSPVLAVDTETLDLEKFDLRTGEGHALGVSIAFRKGDEEIVSIYFPVLHSEDNVSPEVFTKLKRLIHSHHRVVFHNAKFDLVSLQTLGINVPARRYFCTMMMIHFIDENFPSKALDYAAKRILKMKGKEKDAEFNWNMQFYGWSADFPAKVMAGYAARDALLTLLLFEYMIREFISQGFHSD